MMKRLILLAVLLICVSPLQVFASAAFDAASSEYLSRASAVCTTYPLSVSAWFKVNDVDNRYTVFSILDGSPSTSLNVLTELQSDGASVSNFYDQRVRSSAAGIVDNQTGAVTAGAWHHIGGTHAGVADRDVYPDGGTPQNNTTSVSPSGVNTTSIGAQVDTAPQFYMDGKVAEVAVWCGTELSAANMTSLAGGANPLTITPQPTAYWRLLTDATDWFGNNDMSETGTITYSTVDHPSVDAPPGGGGFLNWLLLSK